MRNTAAELRLAALVRDLASHVEQLGCTCVDPNPLHARPNRRRSDATCTGLAIAVAAELRVRRVLKQGREAARRAS